MSRATRRAALGAILAAPLASAPAVAAKPAASPELVRLIAEHDRLDAMVDAECEAGGVSNETRRAAGAMRALIVGFQSACMVDILAKAACLARLFPLSDAEREVQQVVEDDYAYLDHMALNIAVEVMQMAQGKSCA